jgi:hypothetical protein
MRRRLAVVEARATRVARGLWPDRNPLRRTLDRVEGLLVGGLAVAFLVGAPLAAVAAGYAAYSYGARAAYAQQAAAWHPVEAVLLVAAPTYGYTGYEPMVTAQWTAPRGPRHTGEVPAPPGDRAGSTVRVWVDAAGRLTEPPLQPWQVRGQTAMAAVGAPVVLGLMLLCAGLLAHCLLGRRRLASWEADWRATGPQWTRQR